MLGEAKINGELNLSGVHPRLGAIRGSEPMVRLGQAQDARSAVEIIRIGFATDPVARWVYPDAGKYLALFPEFTRAFAGRAFESGGACIATGNSGAALWLPPGVGPDDEAVVSVLETSASPSIKADLFSVLEQMTSFHPKEPHWYLPMIAVDPYFQGAGIGTSLMNFALERCDEEGIPAYLESSNPRNLSLYRRCGFNEIGVIRSGDSPPMFPMIRRPRPYAY